ncbi:hypothetical protein BU14_0243s0003, partial [Porphyra umbilicalis]
ATAATRSGQAAPCRRRWAGGAWQAFPAVSAPRPTAFGAQPELALLPFGPRGASGPDRLIRPPPTSPDLLTSCIPAPTRSPVRPATSPSSCRPPSPPVPPLPPPQRPCRQGSHLKGWRLDQVPHPRQGVTPLYGGTTAHHPPPWCAVGRPLVGCRALPPSLLVAPVTLAMAGSASAAPFLATVWTGTPVGLPRGGATSRTCRRGSTGGLAFVSPASSSSRRGSDSGRTSTPTSVGDAYTLPYPSPPPPLELSVPPLADVLAATAATASGGRGRSGGRNGSAVVPRMVAAPAVNVPALVGALAAGEAERDGDGELSLRSGRGGGRRLLPLRHDRLGRSAASLPCHPIGGPRRIQRSQAQPAAQTEWLSGGTPPPPPAGPEQHALPTPTTHDTPPPMRPPRRSRRAVSSAPHQRACTRCRQPPPVRPHVRGDGQTLSPRRAPLAPPPDEHPGAQPPRVAAERRACPSPPPPPRPRPRRHTLLPRAGRPPRRRPRRRRATRSPFGRAAAAPPRRRGSAPPRPVPPRPPPARRPRRGRPPHWQHTSGRKPQAVGAAPPRRPSAVGWSDRPTPPRPAVKAAAAWHQSPRRPSTAGGRRRPRRPSAAARRRHPQRRSACGAVAAGNGRPADRRRVGCRLHPPPPPAAARVPAAAAAAAARSPRRRPHRRAAGAVAACHATPVHGCVPPCAHTAAGRQHRHSGGGGARRQPLPPSAAVATGPTLHSVDSPRPRPSMLIPAAASRRYN